MSDELIPRAPGDDVIVPVRMRQSSFARFTADPNGRSVDVSGVGMIGLVPSEPDILDESGREWQTWMLVFWSHEPGALTGGVPANQAAADALRQSTTSSRGAERSGDAGAMGGDGGDG